MSLWVKLPGRPVSTWLIAPWLQRGERLKLAAIEGSSLLSLTARFAVRCAFLGAAAFVIMLFAATRSEAAAHTSGPLPLAPAPVSRPPMPASHSHASAAAQSHGSAHAGALPAGKATFFPRSAPGNLVPPADSTDTPATPIADPIAAQP